MFKYVRLRNAGEYRATCYRLSQGPLVVRLNLAHRLAEYLVDDGLWLVEGHEQRLAQVLVVLQRPGVGEAVVAPLLDAVWAQPQPHSIVIVNLQQTSLTHSIMHQL